VSRQCVVSLALAFALVAVPTAATCAIPRGWGGAYDARGMGGRGGSAQELPLAATEKGLVDRYDPWEGFNRRIYRFNANFDKYVFLPALKVWRLVLPSFARRGLSNVLGNVGQIVSLANSLAQLSPTKTVGTIGRIVVNSTIGVGGLLDPATGIGLVDYGEDFGQTLGFYRVPAGPYLVLPILGPSSLRDTTGMIVDRAMLTYLQLQIGPIDDFYDDHPWAAVPIGTAMALQARDDNPFRYGELGAFEYDLIRYFYLEHRKAEIAF